VAAALQLGTPEAWWEVGVLPARHLVRSGMNERVNRSLSQVARALMAFEKSGTREEEGERGRGEKRKEKRSGKDPKSAQNMFKISVVQPNNNMKCCIFDEKNRC